MMAVAVRRELLPMSCAICRKDPTKRVTWGCDEPTEQPLFQLDCPTCDRQGCRDCEGVGKIPIFRCPWATQPRWVVEFFQYYNMHEAGFGLPFSGGMAEQPYFFQQAVRVVMVENSRYEEKKKQLKPPGSKRGRRTRRR